jgi:ParB family transcriptional regulator, chromosome partitioning protein
VAPGTNARVTAACSEAAIGFAKGYRSGVEMAKSTITAIKKQRVPLLIRSDGTILDGDGRCAGVMMIDPDFELDCIVIDGDVTADEAIEIQLVTALHADLKPYEMYLGCVEWLKHHAGATAKNLATAIGRTEGAVSMTLSLSKCCKAVQEAAADGKIGLSDWYHLSKLPEEHQAIALAARLNGASNVEMKRLSRPKAPAVRVARVKCLLPSGTVVTLAAEGDGLSMDDVIETLADLLKSARKAHEDALDASTWQRVLKDKAKAS